MLRRSIALPISSCPAGASTFTPGAVTSGLRRRVTGVGPDDEKLAIRRYRVFKEQTWDALLSLKDIFHYHLINAQGPISEVEQVENLRLLIPILGNEDERRFQMTPIEMMARAAPLVGAVVRGDDPKHVIRIGARTSVQDNCVLHSGEAPTIIEDDCFIGARSEVVEGVLAETGYHAYDQMLQRGGIMPGMQQIIGHLRRDEARHIAYGVYLLSRLVAEHGDAVWGTIEQRLNELLPLAMGIVGEVFEPYPVPPFGLKLEDFADFALSQFGKRVARLEKARGQTLDEVLGTALETEEAGV